MRPAARPARATAPATRRAATAAPATTATSTMWVGTAPPAAATSVGRLKRGEPEVGGSGPTASATQPLDQRARRRGDLARFVRGGVRRQVVAPPGPRPRRRGVRRVHRRGAARLAVGPRRDRQHLEPARQWARRVGRTGADDGEEPDLGVHPGRDRRAAGAGPDRADGAHVLPSGASVTRIPKPSPKGAKDKVLPRGVGTIPACSSGSELTAANLAINTTHRGADEQHAAGQPVRRVSVDERREAQLRQQHRAVARAHGACDGASVRCVLGPAQMSGHSIASAQATQNQTGAWVVDYTLAGRGRLGPVGQGGPGELPPAARDRARRPGLLGADHPADPDELLVLRRQGRDLRGGQTACPKRTRRTWRRR